MTKEYVIPDPIPISFSQARTRQTCARMWAYNKVDELEGLPNHVAEYGARIHQEIEEYLLGFGDATEETEYVDYFLEELKVENYEVEKSVEIYSQDIGREPGFHYRGYVDIAGQLKNGRHFVADWKCPQKKPWSIKPDHWKQVSIYAYLLDYPDDSLLAVVFPTHELYSTQIYDKKWARQYLEECFDVAKEIKNSKAYEIPGKEAKPTVNPLCQRWCSYRDICDAYKEK